jgi:glycosyltransferase involved in cell wall biosynthesis
MKQPRVAFVTCVKNNSRELRQMLKSLIGQDFSEWEAVIVDDHSDEPIKEVCDEFNDDRLRYYKLPENLSGISSARNFAIDQTDTEVLLIADSDDINEPKRARVTYQAMTTNNYDMFYGRLLDFSPDSGEKTSHLFQPFDAELFRMINFITNPSAAFSRKMFDLAGRFDPSFAVSEDYDLYLRMLDKGAKFGYTDEVLVNYRRWPGSSSANKTQVIHEHVMKCRIKNGIAPFNIEKARQFAQPNIAESFLSEKNIALWRDDRYKQ